MAISPKDIDDKRLRLLEVYERLKVISELPAADIKVEEVSNLKAESEKLTSEIKEGLSIFLPKEPRANT